MRLLHLSRHAKGWPIYILLTAIVLLFILLARQNYQSISSELTHTALARRHSIAQLAAATLSEKFKRLTSINIALATRVQFRELIEAGEWDKAADIMQSVPQDFPFIERVFLTDPQGLEMADMPRLEGGVGKNFSHRDWYEGVSSHWEPYISHVYERTAIPKRNLFAVPVPIKTNDGRLLGILVSQVKLDDFFDWAKGLDVGPGGFIYIVDSKGNIAYHPEYPSQDDIVDFTGVPVVQKVLNGQSGVEISLNPVAQEERVAAYIPVNYGWGVIVQQPVQTAFADKNRQLNRILIGYAIFLLFSLAVILMTAWIIRQYRLSNEDRRIKAELERRVAERTAELESFSYSVSHDLRAPLRAIEGFAHILNEDYGNRLDDEARRLIDVIRDNTRKMGTLIDDLLNLSRLSRQAMTLTDVDMATLAREVHEELRSEMDMNNVELIVNPMPQATGDRRLLKQVWKNLVSNAVKYSSTRQQAIIELGGEVKDSEPIYYVKDNGIGFDMQYYDKLFTVFQRLHGEEYAGTGIGLAIVKRVVSRHGGQVWAQSEPDQGSVFYFSLGEGLINDGQS